MPPDMSNLIKSTYPNWSASSRGNNVKILFWYFVNKVLALSKFAQDTTVPISSNW